MSEHVVSVTPHRVESPVFRRGGKYQLVYLRGKTKVRPPGHIECKEGCFLHTDSLGTFGNVAIHFKHKSSSQKYPYAPKVLTFEILDCNAPGSSGAMIGECQVDISQLIDTTTDSCHIKASFDFKMCGFGASLMLTVLVVPRGYPPPPLISTVRAAAQQSTQQQRSGVPSVASHPTGRSVGVVEATVKGGVVDVSRDTAMAVLVALEDTDFGTTGTPEGASAAMSLASLISARLCKIPRARLLQSHDVDAAAGKLAEKASKEHGANTEAVLKRTLQHQLERLQVLRSDEEDWSRSCEQDYAAVRSGRTSGCTVEKSLPLQLLGAKYDVVKYPVPQAPHNPTVVINEVAIHHSNTGYKPPTRPPPPTTDHHNSQPTQPPQSILKKDATIVEKEAPVTEKEPEKVPEPEEVKVEEQPPGTEGMLDMFSSHVKREQKPLSVAVDLPHPTFAEPPTPIKKPIEEMPEAKVNMFEAAAAPSPVMAHHFDKSNPFAAVQPAEEKAAPAMLGLRGESMFMAEKKESLPPVTAEPPRTFKVSMFTADEESPSRSGGSTVVYPTGGVNNMFEGSSGNTSKNPSFGGFGGGVSFGGGDGGGVERQQGGGGGGGWAQFGGGDSIRFGDTPYTHNAAATSSTGGAFHVDPNPSPVSMFAPSNESPRFGAPSKGSDPFAARD